MNAVSDNVPPVEHEAKEPVTGHAWTDQVSRPTTSEKFVYHSLRSAIMSGQLAAGRRIVQSDIAVQHGISVTPVREALRRLETEGLIELEAHKGATVRALSFENAHEIYELRMVLEPMLAPRALAALTDACVAEARELCDRMDRTRDVSEFAEYNRQFHDRLLMLDDLDDSWLSRIVNMLQVAAAPYVGVSLHANPTVMETSNKEHRRILSAFERKDVSAARDLIVHHLSSTMVVLETSWDGGSLDSTAQ